MNVAGRLVDSLFCRRKSLKGTEKGESRGGLTKTRVFLLIIWGRPYTSFRKKPKLKCPS